MHSAIKRQSYTAIERLRIGGHSVSDLLEWLNGHYEPRTPEEAVLECIKTAASVATELAKLDAGASLSKKERRKLTMDIAFLNVFFRVKPLRAVLLQSEGAGYSFEICSQESADWPVAIALRLLLERKMHRVRRCVCGAWFYALRADQQAHSARCRQKKYQDTDEYRRQRRDYMKKNYRLHQSGKVK